LNTLLSCASILWITTMALVSPLSAQTEPELSKELPWFVEKMEPPILPEILVGRDWMVHHLESAGVVAVDIRPISMYDAGHLPGAVRVELPPEPSSLDGIRALLSQAGLRGSEVLVLYGGAQDRSAIGLAFLSLSALGWDNVKVLDIGFETWARAQLPISKDRSLRQSVPLALPPSPHSPFVTREEMIASFGRKGYEILDLRDKGGWGTGYTAPAGFAAGHIPHALPFDVQTLLPATGWPDPAQARGLLMALGPRASEHVQPNATFLLYGEGPTDPALGLGFLLLHILGAPARVFSPGFLGWTKEASDPVVRIVPAEEVQALLAREQSGSKPAGLRDELPKSFILLDLREDWDYNDGHIPGALSLPEHLFAERFDSVLHEHWPKADPAVTPLILYCYGRDCIRSRNCATLAAQRGFRKLLWLREGMSAWEAIDPEPAAR